MAGNWVSIHKQPGGFAVVSLCKEPANTFDYSLWQQLSDAISQCEQDQDIRGVIISSGLKRDIFSAGNDINALYAPKTSKEAYRKFWVLQNRFLASLYRSPLITVAAIRGASPAGGCIIALCCDYRIMTEQGHIGLNEVALGIPVPPKWAGLMVRTIGQGKTETLLQFAKLVSPQEALQLGLIDQVVPKAELLGTAESVIKNFIKAGIDPGRYIVKSDLRKEYSLGWEAFCETEVDSAWDGIALQSTVDAMTAVLKRLSGNKAKPKL